VKSPQKAKSAQKSAPKSVPKSAPKSATKSAPKSAQKSAVPRKAAKSAKAAPAKKPKSTLKTSPKSPPAPKPNGYTLGPPTTPASSVTSAPDNVKKAAPEDSLRFALEAARLAVADKCQNVVLLDVKGLSPVTDYLVLATGTSGRQMASTADEIIQLGKDTDFRPLSSSGRQSETWICVDFVDVLLHLFNADSRQYYDLESLWGDAKRVEFAEK